MSNDPRFLDLVDADESSYEVATKARGPEGSLPLTEEMLRTSPSGDLFAMSQNVGMGWNPSKLTGQQFLILSTQGGIRDADGTPLALGYHTGHWEIGLLARAAAEELRKLGGVPFAGAVTDPCDGRSQGTTAMMDSLAYRNDAAIVLRRLIRSLPTRVGVLGIGTCDKGLPAMMMALAGNGPIAAVLVPGGVTLPPEFGEDAGRIQSIGARFAHGEISLEEAADLGCRACASPGGGCQFLGTAATSQVVGEALGLTVPHAALAPSGQPSWLDMARRSGRALARMAEDKIGVDAILTDDSIHNAMVVHAAFGGSTNLLLHVLRSRTLLDCDDRPSMIWTEVNRRVPRLVDVLPNGPVGHPTVRVFLAGGVPEVMLHLRELDLLRLDVPTVTGQSLGTVLEWWERSSARTRYRELLTECDGVDPDDVILSPDRARERGLTSTVVFPTGNIAPEGSVIKATAIDPKVITFDPDVPGDAGVYEKVGPARVFTRESDAIAAIKSQGPDRVKEGDVLVLICRGPIGAGMEETYQITSALKYLSFGKEVAVVTDARFSGVSTGACIGHVGPEALAGGPVGKILDGDLIRIVIDRNTLRGSIDFVGDSSGAMDPADASKVLSARSLRDDLHADEQLPADTKLWAALQGASGGTWGGCVYDVDSIIAQLSASSTGCSGADGIE